MNKKLRRLCFYQPNDTEAIAAYCQKKAREGWLLEKLGFLMTFRRIEPEALMFSVAYFPDASMFDPETSESQKIYEDYCRAAGWELAAASGPMQIFCTRAECPTPIETDEQYKLDSIRRAMRKTMVVSYALLLVSMLLNLYSQLTRLNNSPLSYISSNGSLLLLIDAAALALLFAWLLIDHGIWCLRSKRSVENGGRCAAPSTRARLAGTWVVLVLGAAMLFAVAFESVQDGHGAVTILVMLGMSAMYAAAFAVRSLLKKHGKSKAAVKWGFIAAVVVIVILFQFIIVKLVMRMDYGRAPAYTYMTSRGHEYDIYRDELPLTLEALGFTVTADDHCSYEAERRGSFLASRGEYLQYAYGDASPLPGLSYTVTLIRSDALRRFCWERTATPLTVRINGLRLTLAEIAPVDPSPWGAREAYKRDGADDYQLLYDDRIVTLRLDKAATAGALDIMREFAAGQ